MKAGIASRRRRPRAGFSLVELVMLVGCTTIILSACGLFFHLLMTLDRTGRDASRDAMAVGRLARQFRRDVHAARRAATPDPSHLDLTSEAGPTVAYRVEPGRLTRTETRPGQPDRHEAFVLNRYAAARFTRGEPEGRLVLEIPRRTEAIPATARLAVRIEAFLDRDARPAAAADGGAK